MHRRRIRFLRQQTPPPRRRRREALIARDDTRCAHVGGLVDDVDRHDHPRDGPAPLAHPPVTRFSGSGPVRFPLGLRRSRREEERTHGEAAVAKHVPDLPLPRAQTARNRLHQQGEPVWRQEPECRARPAPVRTTMALAIALVEAAIRCQVPCGVVGFEAWSLAQALGRILARRRKAWRSRRNTNRLVATASVQRRDAHGGAMTRPGPHLAVEELIPLLPAPAYRAVTVHEQTSGGVTLTGRLPGWGQVRLVVSCAPEAWTGRSVVLVTNRVDWSAAKIIGVDVHRWPTEPCSQDRQGPLGFHESRMRSAEASGKHGCLVFVASSLWPLTCLPAGPDRPKGRIHTMGDACRQQGRALLQQLWVFVHDQWSHGTTADHVLAQVFAKPQGIVPV